MADLVLIAAVAANGVIGRDNRLLWRLKSDMKHFRALTMGKPMIMGRKTFESIGKALPGRHVIVISRIAGYAADGIEVVGSLAAAREAGARAALRLESAEIMIAGGGEIYAAFMPEAKRLEITHVEIAPEGDAFFPRIDPLIWRESRRIAHGSGPDDEAAFAFATYERRAPGLAKAKRASAPDLRISRNPD